VSIHLPLGKRGGEGRKLVLVHEPAQPSRGRDRNVGTEPEEPEHIAGTTCGTLGMPGHYVAVAA